MTVPASPLRPTLTVRFIAFILAASGLAIARIAWLIPLFWPGYVLWFGWIAIALGSSRFDKVWFWSSCVIWDAGMMALLFSFQNEATGFLHVRIHAAGVLGLSILVLAIHLRRARHHVQTPGSLRGKTDAVKGP